MIKPKITRTYGPIHFEDLDPHRFEDLIRQLIYDYKDWQNIEATGRSGSDDGFDVRAYEKVVVVTYSENENNEEIEEFHPMEGNLWMIQAKREKVIGPKKIKTIISDIDLKNPPYGYILAASTNFSKKSYDVFRKELRKKGVMEFYLWGKADLEDMLYLPKNDRILFTFFGVSLVSKRKTRTTKIRSVVNIKNKLFRTVGKGYNFQKSILIRDLEDTNYPYKSKYSDFKTYPRWKEYIACGHHQLGLVCHGHKYFAYIDTVKKEWDFNQAVDMLYRQKEDDDERQKASEKINLIKDVWDFFPKKNQGYFVVDFLIKYSDIVLIDEKGDIHYNFPHIYANFAYNLGPFARHANILKINDKKINLTDDYKRINVFPKKFKKEKYKKIYKDKKILLTPESQKEFKNWRLDTIYEADGKYAFLNSRDVIQIGNQGPETEKEFIQITHRFKENVRVHIEQSLEPYRVKRDIELQLGRKPTDSEEINIYEFKRISQREFKKN